MSPVSFNLEMPMWITGASSTEVTAPAGVAVTMASALNSCVPMPMVSPFFILSTRARSRLIQALGGGVGLLRGGGGCGRRVFPLSVELCKTSGPFSNKMRPYRGNASSMATIRASREISLPDIMLKKVICWDTCRWGPKISSMTRSSVLFRGLEE